ncbi:phage minor head protein [Porcipelethomonas sp.]|uniref:phage minor head protein n=1 Tax=Porcipelethomonas sp. TaxID=2981675 RepID=UPI0030786AB7
MPKAEQSLNDLLHEIRRIEQSREVLTEKKIRKIYKQLLKELNHFLADEYLKYSKDGILTVAMLQEKSRYAKFLEEIESHVNNLTPEIVALIKNTVEDTYTACYKGMSESVLKAKDTKSALNYLKDLNIRPEVMKRAIENPVSGLTLPDILEKNRKEVIYDIKQQVNIGLMNGDRYETTAKKVAERLDISYGKATNIVRTETHRVTESGFMDCAKDISDSLDGSGLVYTAAWRTMKDERVRPQHRYRTKSGWKTSISRNGANHQKMEGVIIQVGDKFQLEPNVYAECPSTSGTARNDCRCRCFLEYTLMSVEKFEELTGKSVDKSGGSGIMNTGAISGALNPYSKAAEKHATQYYESVRHMKTDTLHISRSTGISQNKIDKIKNHVFISEHDLIDGKRRFDPDYEMAQSWQRLINGNFREQDIVLLKHEYAELRYMEKGFSQYEAHLKASKKYNFAKYCE